MSSLKVEMEKNNNRSALNTTINTEVFEEFKKSCKISGIAMNTLIETFMKQYNNGEFFLKFGKQRTLDLIDNNDNKENFGEIVE